MNYEIIKRNTDGENPVQGGKCDSYEDAFEVYMDCIIDNGQDDNWLLEDYLRIKRGQNNMLYKRNLGWLKKNKCLTETFLSPIHEKPYELELKVSVGSEALLVLVAVYKVTAERRINGSRNCTILVYVRH